MKGPARGRRRRSSTLRRSFVLPVRLVEQVSEAAPPECRGNLSGIVRNALEEYVIRRREEAFAAEMQRMAEDPEIRAESAAIEREFRVAEGDGLPEEPR